MEDGSEIDDDETFKVCANDIFVFLVRWTAKEHSVVKSVTR